MSYQMRDYNRQNGSLGGAICFDFRHFGGKFYQSMGGGP